MTTNEMGRLNYDPLTQEELIALWLKLDNSFWKLYHMGEKYRPLMYDINSASNEVTLYI